ncbi:MAG: VWA domain-containing protein [Rhodospirillales bacterium]
MTVTELRNLIHIGVGPELEYVEPLSDKVLNVFPETLIARWLRATRKLEQAGYGQVVVRRYVRHSVAVAEIVSPLAAINLADAVSTVAIKAGIACAEALPRVAEDAANHLKEDQLYISWMGIVVRFAALAPESMSALLDRMDYLLDSLSVSRLEAWVFAGLRASGGDVVRRQRFFAFDDPEAERWLQRESGEVIFSDLEMRLRYYLDALWGFRNPLREPPINAPKQARRRSSFDRGVIRLPTSYPGYRGVQAEDLYRAAVAHIGAHMAYSGDRYELAKLKPIQVALVSLIEDARVEQLAMQEFPGLRRLWMRFHIAQATGALTAPSLFARLSRALIDLDFDDVDGFVRKGRELFFDRRAEWGDPTISREIGSLLGNDLGQMRVQFNARTYVVEPPYRDDNLGLWNFDDEHQEDTLEAEQLFDSVRIEQQEDETETPDREREEIEERPEDDRKRANVENVEIDGIPVARYPEYDHETGRERPEWTTVVEYPPTVGETSSIDDFLDRRSDIVHRISNLISSARVSRHQRVRRQQEGEFLDIDACIEAVVSRRIGDTPDQRIYGRWERRNRDLSVLVLLDVSESTNDRVLSGTETVLELERNATALLAHAMAGLGDPFAVAAFCSDRRESVHYYRIKEFDGEYDALAKAYLAGLQGGYSTRIGAAMRHAGSELARRLTHRKLLLVVSDGEPSDIDVSDPEYLVEDARKAVQTLSQMGVDVFCVGLDSGGDSYLHRIFGRRNVVQIDRLEALPERLPMLYLRLTA